MTELVTGLDLVELMIRSAAGEKLPLKRKDVALNGWAVEARIYAEDPYRGFLPSTGRLSRYRPPAEGRRGEIVVRNDTGVYEGGEISIYYDPMIAKLCTHAPTREEAIDAMAAALDEFRIEGIHHNIDFLDAIMHNQRFREGRLTTGFIAEEYPDGFHGRPLDAALERRFIGAALAAKLIRTERAGAISGTLNGALRPGKEFVVCIGDGNVDVTDATFAGGAITANIAGQFYGAKLAWRPGDTVMHLIEEGQRHALQIVRKHGGYLITHGGARALVTVRSRLAAELAALMPEKEAADTSKFLLCPMPGLIVSVNVAQGQEVKAGEILAVVEAMKMENVLSAERDGVIKVINAKKGDSLALDDVILEFA